MPTRRTPTRTPVRAATVRPLVLKTTGPKAKVVEKIDFRTMGATQQTVKKLKLKKNDIGPVINDIHKKSAPKALQFSKAVMRNWKDNTKRKDEAREMVKWAKGVGGQKRKMVSQAFNQSGMRLPFILCISELNKRDARVFMKDYFASGGDMKSVLQFLQLSDAALRKHRLKRPSTDSAAVDVVKDVV